MRRGPINIPFESLGRTMEFLDGARDYNSLKFKGRVLVCFGNLISHLYKVHHFDSIGEFLEYRDNLRIDVDRVAFREVEVVGIHDDYSPGAYVGKDDKIAQFNLEIDLADKTGQTKLFHQYNVRVWNGDLGSPDEFNDPALGSNVGDKVEIYAATYQGKDSPLLLLVNFHLRNDAHYKKIQDIRSED